MSKLISFFVKAAVAAFLRFIGLIFDTTQFEAFHITTGSYKPDIAERTPDYESALPTKPK